MIEKDPPFFWNVTCDECGDDLQPCPDGDLTFAQVVKEIQAADWLVMHTGEGWEHYCPDCKEAF